MIFPKNNVSKALTYFFNTTFPRSNAPHRRIILNDSLFSLEHVSLTMVDQVNFLISTLERVLKVN